MLLSQARALDAFGLDYYSDELDDFSVAGDLAVLDLVDEVLAGLREYERADLSQDQQLSYDVLEWLLTLQQERREFLYHAYPVNQFSGSQNRLPDFMVNIHQVDDEEDARNYLTRIALFGVALDQLRASVLARAERGIVPPRFVLAAVKEETRAFAASDPSKNVLYTKFEDALQELTEFSEAERAGLLEELQSLLTNRVYPGYRDLSDLLADLESTADDRAGVWKHPNGDAYYRWALRWHTTTDLSPGEIHSLGLTEIERIHGEMSRILASEGLPTEDPMATLRELNRDPRFLYPDTDEGREQILADYRTIIADVDSALPRLFSRLPRAAVEVQRVPSFKEAGAAGAYYNPPSFDGERPGVFYANLRNVSEVHRFGMRTLAFHEAVPGHHLQIALAMEDSTLPFFRRFLPTTAFIEGWALYAERLALEEGLHKTPYDELGALSAELFRAVRLVVDTGIHAKRWTRERAIDFMVEKAGHPRGDATAEIERYIVAPGQACAYKMGQLKILELRQRAKQALGNAFDLRAFNDAILANGALPLPVLEQATLSWIETQASRS